MSGGIAYVLDENNDLYTKVNKQMVSVEKLGNKYDVQELKDMIMNGIIEDSKTISAILAYEQTL